MPPGTQGPFFVQGLTLTDVLSWWPSCYQPAEFNFFDYHTKQPLAPHPLRDPGTLALYFCLLPFFVVTGPAGLFWT